MSAGPSQGKQADGLQIWGCLGSSPLSPGFHEMCPKELAKPGLPMPCTISGQVAFMVPVHFLTTLSFQNQEENATAPEAAGPGGL